MSLHWRPREITVDRGNRGFGLSLIYRGLDKYEEKETGIFVARVVPGGQASKHGVKENDKLLSINGKTPRNVDDAVAVIKQAGNKIRLSLLRLEETPEIVIEGGELDSSWTKGEPISRSGSAKSFNTGFGRSASTPSPRNPRAYLGTGVRQQAPPSPSIQNRQQQEFLRQQAAYRAQQQREQQLQEQRQREQLLREQQLREQQQRERELQQQREKQKQQYLSSNNDTVRQILQNTDFSEFEPKSNNNRNYPSNYGLGQRVIQNGNLGQETKTTSTENITRIIETIRPGTSQSGKYKSSSSLHELGLDNYPNPEYPESSRLTRKEEKQSLQNLNNRLAGYIDRVRQLQQENAKLTHQVKTVEEFQSREINNVKDVYDRQINDLKNDLEALNKQYNQLKVASEGLFQENEDLRDSIKKKDRDLANSVTNAETLEDEIRKLANKMAKVEQERKKAKEELKTILPELEELRKKVTELKRALDNEQLKKADLENQYARLEEDLKFKLQLLEKELAEVKSRKELELNELDGKLQEEYEDRLKKALEELRELYDKQMEQNRDDFAKLYDERVKDLQAQLSSERGKNVSSIQELKEARGRIETLIGKVSDLENANLALNQKISDLAQAVEDTKSAHRAQMAAKDGEIKRLLDELADQLKQFRDLQDLKVQLDMEIAVYRRLLESEEDRLGLGDKTLFVGQNKEPSSRYKTSIQKTKETTVERKFTVSQTQL